MPTCANDAEIDERGWGLTIYRQAFWYFIAWCVITPIVNSMNCIWVAVCGHYLPVFIYNIGTTVLMGGISMVIYFFAFKIIFPEDDAGER